MENLVIIAEEAKKIVKKFGKEKQLRQAQEECAELIVAINHYNRGRKNSREEVIMETAHVALMIYQIMDIFRISSEQLANIMVDDIEKLLKK